MSTQLLASNLNFKIVKFCSIHLKFYTSLRNKLFFLFYRSTPNVECDIFSTSFFFFILSTVFCHQILKLFEALFLNFGATKFKFHFFKMFMIFILYLKPSIRITKALMIFFSSSLKLHKIILHRENNCQLISLHHEVQLNLLLGPIISPT